MQIRRVGGGTAVEERRNVMWSEDPGGAKRPAHSEATDVGRAERGAEPVSTAPLRWFFGFDGWRLDPEEDEFVLA
jgi:hypothetical protein